MSCRASVLRTGPSSVRAFCEPGLSERGESQQPVLRFRPKPASVRAALLVLSALSRVQGETVGGPETEKSGNSNGSLLGGQRLSRASPCFLLVVLDLTYFLHQMANTPDLTFVPVLTRHLPFAGHHVPCPPRCHRFLYSDVLIFSPLTVSAVRGCPVGLSPPWTHLGTSMSFLLRNAKSVSSDEIASLGFRRTRSHTAWTASWGRSHLSPSTCS